MQATRRIFLQKTLIGSTSVMVLGTGLLRSALATWPQAAFDAESLDVTLQALYAGDSAEASDAIKLKAPDIAENGAVVPVSIQTDLAKVESISLLVEHNPAPLAASFNLTPETIADVSTRIKMGETSNVIAIVKVDGKLFMASQQVKVTIGGCGG